MNPEYVDSLTTEQPNATYYNRPTTEFCYSDPYLNMSLEECSGQKMLANFS